MKTSFDFLMLTAAVPGAKEILLRIVRLSCYPCAMKESTTSPKGSEPRIWAPWLFRITQPLHKPIGNDMYVENFWLRLSTWRYYAVTLPIAFIVGWFVIPNVILYLVGALHRIIR